MMYLILIGSYNLTTVLNGVVDRYKNSEQNSFFIELKTWFNIFWCVQKIPKHAYLCFLQ